MEYDVQTILDHFRSLTSPKDLKGMARFGINTDKAFGLSLPAIRQLAKEIGKNHELALELWETGYRECRHLAGMIAEFDQLDTATMDHWVSGFNSWDTCDSVCMNLFRYSPLAWKRIAHYAASEEEFTRRTAFTLIAELSVSDKKASDSTFLAQLPLIEQYSTDPRNFVRKAVNWALRQIGKRNQLLYPQALALAEKLKDSPDKTARWIGRDAYRELTTEKIITRIKP